MLPTWTLSSPLSWHGVLSSVPRVSCAFLGHLTAGIHLCTEQELLTFFSVTSTLTLSGTFKEKLALNMRILEAL